MSGQQLDFPPPPPAPPQASYGFPGHGQTFQNGYVGRGNKGRWQNRGQGRGNNRGGPRGGYAVTSNPNAGYGGYPAGNSRQYSSPNAGYNTQVNGYGGSYSLPQYPAVQQPQYPADLQNTYGQTHPPHQAANSRPPQPSFSATSQNTGRYYGGLLQQSSVGYGSQVGGNQNAPYTPFNNEPLPPMPTSQGNQPIMMGPPIRIGFDVQKASIQSHHSQPNRQSSPNPFQHIVHDSRNSFPGHRGRGQKRGHGEAFNRSRNQNPKSQVAPAVPSFGGPLPLPVKPPLPQDDRPRRPRKKKRKHNQLGLTPKTEEHESSEEEDDDIDEEARLTAAAGGSGQQLQQLRFSYRGQTSTLQSSSEISTWIEERKKRFPTKARAAEIAEQKREREERRDIANQARKEAQGRQRASAKERQEADRKQNEKTNSKDLEEGLHEAAAKVKRKVEKLRRQLEKEERRAAKAEAKASKTKEGDPARRKRKRSHSQGSLSTVKQEDVPIKSEGTDHAGTGTLIAMNDVAVAQIKREFNDTAPQSVALGNSQHNFQEAISTIPDPLTPTSQPPTPDDQLNPPTLALHTATAPTGLESTVDLARQRSDGATDAELMQSGHQNSVSTSDSDSEILSTDLEDLTSSSGSSSSDSGSDDEAPDQATAKRKGPEKVVPPKRVKNSPQICRDFVKDGRCRRGDQCKYLHALPVKGSRSERDKEQEKPQAKNEKIGLYQRLVEQQQQKEDHDILAAIIDLGENGYLEAPLPNDGEEPMKSCKEY